MTKIHIKIINQIKFNEFILVTFFFAMKNDRQMGNDNFFMQFLNHKNSFDHSHMHAFTMKTIIRNKFEYIFDADDDDDDEISRPNNH